VYKRQGYTDCKIELLDSRSISHKQRKSVYALLRTIGNYTGQGLSPTKEALKKRFIEEELGEEQRDFLFSNSSMSMAYAFQRYLVRFILDFDIPCDFPLVDFVDDIEDYIYACAMKKKCCICGREAEPHHHDRIGMGMDREKINHLRMRMEPLCREHHSECHTMPQNEFDEKYHIVPIEINEEIEAVWDLNKKEYED